MKTNSRTSSWKLVQAACLSLIFGLIWTAPVHAHTFGGRAFTAFVNVLSLGAGSVYLGDTGELGPSGGWEGAGLPGAQVPSVLSANVLNATTSGAEYDAGAAAQSSSSLADVVVLPGQIGELTVSFVRAQAEASGLGSHGSTEVYDLVFGGIPVTVTGLPNQRVEIPGLPGPIATLIINEQTVTSDGGTQTIMVNALHLILATGEEVILGSATSSYSPTGGGTLAGAGSGVRPAAWTTRAGGSDGTCASNTTPVRKLLWRSDERPPIIPVWDVQCIDFVTGGGFFLPPNSTRPGRVNFGFNAGPRSAQNPTLRGHVNVVDHDGFHIKGVTVDSYTTVGSEPCRIFEGDAVFNGVPGFRYRVGVCDYGEPGRFDRFRIDVFNAVGDVVYSADNARSDCPGGKSLCGELDGGNIQLHKEKCPKQNAGFTGTARLDI